jgi:hypothetical protein
MKHYNFDSQCGEQGGGETTHDPRDALSGLLEAAQRADCSPLSGDDG